MKENQGFFEWVTTRRAHDNPRGDFIRDTRDTFKHHGESGCERLYNNNACWEAQRVGEALRREWEKLNRN